MIEKKKQAGIWLAWLLIWPIVVSWLYHHYSVDTSFDRFSFSAFLLLAVMVALFPITINKTPIFLINSVSLATFLIFGLFIEIIVTQLAMIFVLIRLKISKHDGYRIPLNLLMFLAVSLTSASAYYLSSPYLPERLEFLNHNILQLLIYMFIAFLVNQIILFLIKRFIYNQEVAFLGEGFYFSLFIMGYTIPSGIVLVYLYQSFNTVGILMMSIPIVAISISLKLYYQSKTTNQYLIQINQLAHKLTGYYTRDNILKTYLSTMPKIFPANTVVIYELFHGNQYKRIRLLNHEQESVLEESVVERNGHFIVEQAVNYGKTTVYHKAKRWEHLVTNDLANTGESMMVMPIQKNYQTVAVIVIVAKQRYVFSSILVSVFTVLNPYLGIALDNAKYYESIELKSQTDHLTRLPNLRYFEKVLTDYGEISPSGECSLIMIDLDYFKMINDQYGHECGNEVLVQVADLIRDYLKKHVNVEVARYGGEEFIIFLPNYKHAKGFKLAEEIRSLIEQTDFICRHHILNHQTTIKLNLTASLGVASYPDQTDHFDELIRLADRAMYTGAKREGRNKVAAYQY
ncbi:sensor domain-containing diguanylate cyclase [Amphibacillus cookii]|uniref:sensor domain-containing diguanylate cyclase n=1 Tax=Amphibacillus cookii TaxID=767787 RepID=UPI00195D33C3|nr:GGDEF domain-containing protein [Amphibacillus cookii]MBM7541797.1 diguanylate cyclase (GGDEF)-like protein [Amphibacillus cookii]